MHSETTQPKRLKRVFIANRGEIAIRIAKTASALGMDSVGVYATVDALSLHPRFMTEAHEVSGGDGAVGAYLDIERLVQIAKQSGCDCVHPGYGFLSENAEFATRCEAEGLTFVGPSPAALALFGNKVEARALAHSLDIPVIQGSAGAVSGLDEALELGRLLGYPLMLKASAGGGGRGMRMVAQESDMAAAFERCRSEAEAAFGNGAVFVERLIERPRHIEVQVLADAYGTVIHLHERDCSVQLRNQKVVEIAPAPNLAPDLKKKMHTDAVRLVAAAHYVNAGTVEFLVSPESGAYYFIECNPRIQVEHTVTEQVLGLDLIEAQLRVASGASLESLGLGDQHAVGMPQGYAIQGRVVVEGPGTLSAYREPNGPGVRVDGCGYLGLAPPPQFDPLLAKLICGSDAFPARRPVPQPDMVSFPSAVDRTIRALDEFHIAGLPTNLDLLRAILGHAAFRSGDARTTLLAEDTELTANRSPSRGTPSVAALTLLESQASRLGAARPRAQIPNAASIQTLPVPDGHIPIESPLTGSIIKCSVVEGSPVIKGDTLFVISAMKMESTVDAPCSGTLSAMLRLQEGDMVSAGQILVAIEADSQTLAAGDDPADPKDSWGPTLVEVETLRRLAHQRLGPESTEPGVERQRNRGKLTCRDRIDRFLDDGSFREVGSVAGFATRDEDGAIVDFTPANHVGGWGAVSERTVVVCADDFTSRGGHADGAIGEKSRYLDSLSIELRVPSVRLLDGSSGGGSVAAMVPQQRTEGESKAKESTGAIAAGRPRVTGSGGSSLPGHLGSTMYTEQLSTVPVVNLLLGSVVGIGAAKAVLGHFSVMVRDIAQLFVAGPPVVSHAMGYDITKEDLGGWHIHCTNGSVDNLAETEEEAFAMTRAFLSYLPLSVYEAPPVLPPDPQDPPHRRDEALTTVIPRKRTATFDIRKAIMLMADKNSFFEIGPLWGTDQVTGFVRFNGHPVGVIASDSRHINGGAMTADGCDKLRRHLDLCDTFHLPLLNLVDNPGFAVGLEHEMAGTIRKGGEWMIAFAQVGIPIFTVIMRRSFGVAGNNFAMPRARPSVRVAWPAADTGSIPPEGGIEAAYKRQLAEAEDPEALRAELEARIESARGPLGPLSRFQIEEMIDPRDTRLLICEWVETAYRLLSQADKLGPRPLQFRP